MSTSSGSGWVNAVMLVLAGGLVFYGLARGPGSCPLAPSQPAAPTTPMSGESADGASTGAEKAVSLRHADESSFDGILREAKGPVLVDFYADWCGPCQKLAPVLDRVAEGLTDGHIVKVNVDHSPALASRYQVQSIPTLLVFNDGKLVKRSMGFHDEDEVRQLLQ